MKKRMMMRQGMLKREDAMRKTYDGRSFILLIVDVFLMV